jgi:hypothetical protein
VSPPEVSDQSELIEDNISPTNAAFKILFVVTNFEDEYKLE